MKQSHLFHRLSAALVALLLLAAIPCSALAAAPAVQLYSFSVDKPLAEEYRIGDIVYFGRYEQDNYTAAKEDIAWMILEIREDKALLLSRYILDTVPYHSKSQAVTWADCTLRKWLNNTFLNNAFNASERQNIVPVYIQNPDNIEYHTRGGSETKDTIFLLSYDDATNYFWSNAERQAYATDYALYHGAFLDEKNNYSWWWLRTPGQTADSACNVRTRGIASTYGGLVYSSEGGVRPAMWVNVDALH